MKTHPAIGKFDPRCTHFEIAFMLEEIQMPSALRLGVVDRMQSFHPFVRKPAAFGEIDGDGQEPLAGVERDIAHVPGGSDARAAAKVRCSCSCSRWFPRRRGPAAIMMPPCSQPSRTSPGVAAEGRPFLTATARDGPIPAQAGAEEWPRTEQRNATCSPQPLPTRFSKEAPDGLICYSVLRILGALYLTCV